jgi:hypothetical protein
MHPAWAMLMQENDNAPQTTPELAVPRRPEVVKSPSTVKT